MDDHGPGDRLSQVHVAAGVICNPQGQVLVSKRPIESHQGGLWEFPGGKLEPGETVEQGLIRELAEELGIRVTASRPLIRLRHDYGDRQVLLDMRRVLEYRGTPQGREGQPLDWLHPEAMDPDRFPAADRPVISALRLPTRYLITGADPFRKQAFADQLAQVLATTGIRLVQLRAPELDAKPYAQLAERCAMICQAAGTRLLLNCPPSLAASLPGDGLHLTEPRLRSLSERPRLGRRLVGASCHNVESLNHAASLGLDYALLSPVFRTQTHPQATPLGWAGFFKLADAARFPVYALGGIGPDALPKAFECGAQGVAGIRAFWPTSGSSD